MRFYILKNQDDCINAIQLIVKARNARKENQKIALQAFEVQEEDVRFWGTEYTYTSTIIGVVFNDNRKTEIEGLKLKGNIYFPDKRTKKGKQISKKLESQIYIAHFETEKVLDLKLTMIGKFTTPVLFLLNDKEIILKCDDRIDLDRERFEEVTRTFVDDNLNKDRS